MITMTITIPFVPGERARRRKRIDARAAAAEEKSGRKISHFCVPLVSSLALHVRSAPLFICSRSYKLNKKNKQLLNSETVGRVWFSLELSGLSTMSMRYRASL